PKHYRQDIAALQENICLQNSLLSSQISFLDLRNLAIEVAVYKFTQFVAVLPDQIVIDIQRVFQSLDRQVKEDFHLAIQFSDNLDKAFLRCLVQVVHILQTFFGQEFGRLDHVLK